MVQNEKEKRWTIVAARRPTEIACSQKLVQFEPIQLKSFSVMGLDKDFSGLSGNTNLP